MTLAQSNSPFLPFVIAAGTVDGATGNAGSGLFGVASTGLARTGKGTYTVTLADKPAASSFVVYITSTQGALRVFEVTGYVAGTGVLSISSVDQAVAAQDGSFAFLILGIPSS